MGSVVGVLLIKGELGRKPRRRRLVNRFVPRFFVDSLSNLSACSDSAIGEPFRFTTAKAPSLAFELESNKLRLPLDHLTLQQAFPSCFASVTARKNAVLPGSKCALAVVERLILASA